MKTSQKKIFVLISILFLLVSLTQPCYSVEGTGKDTVGAIGLIAFLLGWLNFNLIGIVWLANPLLLLSMIFLFKKEKFALITSGLALLFSLCFFLVDRIIINEGGTTGKIDHVLVGYWLWLSSIFVIFICSLVTRVYRKK
ncbi:conserved membrane hypothetical protein [Tenacibaculum sp. 190524A05c]|uniref:hypothetical protein n=1 Tax=Tenacibaculum platacis TaxID=3137852 RepID=UPI0031FA5F7E